MYFATIVENAHLELTVKTVSIRLSEDLVNSARQAATAEFRTIQGQLEYWARIGRAALDNPDLPTTFVAGLLQGIAENRDSAIPFEPRSKNKK